jgi:hypothetical protein
MSWFKRKPKNTEPPHVYEFGGGWGDALTWDDFREGRCHGFKRRIPKIGDLAVAKMESGRKLVCKFTKVEPCGDPVDMFFANVEMVDYADTEAGKAALAAAETAPAGMHPDAHRFWDPPPVEG